MMPSAPKMLALCRHIVPRHLLKPGLSNVSSRSTMSTRMTAYEEMSQYWNKNRQLNRPLSPHLTVYRFHLTMALSITNRVTASAQQAVLTGVPILLVLGSGDFSHYFQVIKDMDIPSPVILGAKFLIAFPFAFHLMAGLRHLVWDAGIGFGKTATYQGGVAIIIATVVLTAALMLYKPTLEDKK